MILFNEYLNEERERNRKFTIIDIWRKYETIYYNDYQTVSDSPIMQIQERILELLLSKDSTKDWPDANKFKPDNSFGPTTIKALGIVLNIKFKNPKSVTIGPNTLRRLGFTPPPVYSKKLYVLATTLVVESGPSVPNSETKAIGNVILNRAFIRSMDIFKVIAEHKQFSLWNNYDINSSAGRFKLYKKEKPENAVNWTFALNLAKTMLAGGKISDNTNGSTHYFNSNIVIPGWSTKPTWHSENFPKFTHTFGRDTATSWAKKPVIRS